MDVATRGVLWAEIFRILREGHCTDFERCSQIQELLRGLKRFQREIFEMSETPSTTNLSKKYSNTTSNLQEPEPWGKGNAFSSSPICTAVRLPFIYCNTKPFVLGNIGARGHRDISLRKETPQRPSMQGYGYKRYMRPSWNTKGHMYTPYSMSRMALIRITDRAMLNR